MTTTYTQLDLFQADESEPLFRYWRGRLIEWPREVFRFRHWQNTTGWSMATQGFLFAELLYRHGQMTRDDFRRWFRFRRRVKRCDCRGENAPCEARRDSGIVLEGFVGLPEDDR